MILYSLDTYRTTDTFFISLVFCLSTSLSMQNVSNYKVWLNSFSILSSCVNARNTFVQVSIHSRLRPKVKELTVEIIKLLRIHCRVCFHTLYEDRKNVCIVYVTAVAIAIVSKERHKCSNRQAGVAHIMTCQE